MSPFTVTSKQPLRGFSSLTTTFADEPAFTSASSFVARVLNAPHDLHASILTRPPPPEEPEALALGRLFFTMVFFGAI